MTEPHRDRGDDAERAFASDEQLGQLRPDAVSGQGGQLDDVPVGQHHLQRHCVVFLQSRSIESARI